MTRRKSLSRLSKLYSSVEGIDDTTCFYCGCSSECVDHVPPVSVADSLGQGLLYKFRYVLIPSCQVCNSILSNRILPMVELRCLVLAGEYAKTYASYLIIDDDEDDIYSASELDRRKRIIHINRDQLKQRIDYLTGINNRMWLVESVVTPKLEDDGYKVHKRNKREEFSYPLIIKEKANIPKDTEESTLDLSEAVSRYYEKVHK